MAQEFMYMPFQRLDSYEYHEKESFAYIVESMNVYLRYGEYLECREKEPFIPVGAYSIDLHFDVKGTGVVDTSYLCEPGPVLIRIEPRMIYTVPASSAEDVKAADIQGKIGDRLIISRNPLTYSVFTVRAIIYPPAGYNSVPVTNTISQGGEVVIVA
jgi:hypothetical protein